MQVKNSLMNAYQSSLVLLLILFFIQVSYAGPEGVKQQIAPEKEVGIEKQTSHEKDEEKTEKKEERYEYTPVGKLDPFVSFLKEGGKGDKGTTSLSSRDLEQRGEEAIIPQEEPATELETIEIAKLTLTAVVRGKSKVWAMVIDPKGKGYFLEKGTKIGTHSGVVDEIICEERQTAFGPEIVRKVIIKVPYRDRNRKIIYRSIEMEMPSSKM